MVCLNGVFLVYAQRTTYMSNSDESPNTENDKYCEDLLELRFVRAKDQFEDQADRDDNKIKCQKDLGKEFFDAESSNLHQKFSHENAVDNRKIRVSRFVESCHCRYHQPK